MVLEIPGISIVITVKNEGNNIKLLLGTLSKQRMPFEVVIVDSMSNDGTESVVETYSGNLDLNYIRKECSRGQGRNIGVGASKYPYIVFTDGDTEWSEATLSHYYRLFEAGNDLIAGEVIPKGRKSFFLDRVKLVYEGFEVTSPSANLGITKKIFSKIHGFDEDFVTAEDIDLNIRAIQNGAVHSYCKKCVVYNKVRENLGGFARQAFWNGYGRYQLKKKHKSIWNDIEKEKGIHNYSFYNIVRLSSASAGYIYSKLMDGKRPRM
ncbi:MAG: glycosyltransferase [Thermoplasmatales archaeon]|nr:glycosyltransferase [Thermoplasmatales archaeon]MCW6170673.1 glycosyltransferase [Thermoplasmatales archaeon]